VIDPALYRQRKLKGGFTIVDVDLTQERLTDALGRQAIARTRIIAREFFITLQSGLSDQELSITLYHEVLEAAAVAATDPPESVMTFNEADFERAAYQAHRRFGEASPENLDQMLQSYGFGEK
jgi:hypothetical protein